MRIAIISDTHFGDPMGTLVNKNANGDYILGDKYTAFHNAVGTGNDYLVLLGDILDFSIVSYKEAYEAAKVFFIQIQNDNIAREIIYVPGNHDADLWHIVENQVNIIMQIDRGRPPAPFRMSVPGFIDARKGSPNKNRLMLRGVTARDNQNRPRYAGLFLDKITTPEGVPTFFNFAYPNIYMVTDNESVLITHGHYLDVYWSLLSEWSMKIFQEALEIGSTLDMKEMVGINFPLSQLACSGIGQAGPLTGVVRQLQRDIKDGKFNRIKKYLDRLDNEIDNLTKYPVLESYKEWLTDAASNWAKDMIMDVIKNVEETRYNEEFIHKKDVQERFMRFYNASLIEIDDYSKELNCEIPIPTHVIFGHTHQPTKWGDPSAPKIGPVQAAGKPIRLYNSGGWLNRDNNGTMEFCGAEIFIYESETGFRSVTVK